MMRWLKIILVQLPQHLVDNKIRECGCRVAVVSRVDKPD